MKAALPGHEGARSGRFSRWSGRKSVEKVKPKETERFHELPFRRAKQTKFYNWFFASRFQAREEEEVICIGAQLCLRGRWLRIIISVDFESSNLHTCAYFEALCLSPTPAPDPSVLFSQISASASTSHFWVFVVHIVFWSADSGPDMASAS